MSIICSFLLRVIKETLQYVVKSIALSNVIILLVFMTSFIGCLVWKLLSDNRNYIVSEGTMKTILITKRTLSDLSLKRYYEDLEFETIKYERMVVYRSLDKRKWTWWLTLHYNHLTSNAFRTVRFWVQIYLTSSDKCIPEKRIQYKISNCFLLNEIFEINTYWYWIYPLLVKEHENKILFDQD